jgi:hypothetical protein
MKKNEFKAFIDRAISNGEYPTAFDFYAALDSVITSEITSEITNYNELKEMIKSESVGRLLRYGVKRPSTSGMDDCDDKGYYDLYEYRKTLYFDFS